jgi:hypothetical protein
VSYDVFRIKNELAEYLKANAVERPRTVDEIIQAMFDRGAFPLDTSVMAASRVLRDLRRELVKEGLPIGPFNNGWKIVEHLGEYNDVEAREGGRADSIRVGLAELKKAFYSWAAKRQKTGIAGEQTSFTTTRRAV